MVVEDELSGIQRELSMFPERAFDFQHAGTIVIEQDVADVGSVVWDAEVLLAHYLDQAYGSRLQGMRLLEVGAGTGLAGIVAARLGASVVLTDQSKILPTLEKNARSNARDLECRRLPASPVLCRGTTAAVSPPAADAADPPKNVAKASSTETDDLATPASLASTAGSSPTLSGERCGCGTAARADSASRQQSDSSHAGEDGGTDVKGRWLATELLFSDSAEDLLRWRRSIFVGGRDTASGEAEEDEQGGAEADDDDLFDLVVAADVVYLNDMWDAMAFTMKALLKPKGEALMTFEQRRSNVDGFFGPPRFGGENDAWEHGEELDFEEGGAADGKELGGAAKVARVRMFRMRRRGGGIDGLRS